MIFLLRTSSSPALMRGTLLRSQVRDKVPHSEPLRSRSFTSTITGSNPINTTPQTQDQTTQYRSVTVNELASRVSALAESAQQSMNSVFRGRISPPSPCSPSSSTPPPAESRTSIDYLIDTHTTTPYTSPPTPATGGSSGGGGGDIISSTFLSDGESDADMNKHHSNKGDEQAEGEEREGHAHPHEEEDDEGEEDEGGEVERAM
ncbi:hypothetical protein IQ07DRAFT_238767 [Pyrenochaeta sp. DS3sAY3a]|nr:hypothetical protein IQ07DRAFT_238767 [Pyrenochaeta sp. DS3sAY3a]